MRNPYNRAVGFSIFVDLAPTQYLVRRLLSNTYWQKSELSTDRRLFRNPNTTLGFRPCRMLLQYGQKKGGSAIGIENLWLDTLSQWFFYHDLV